MTDSEQAESHSLAKSDLEQVILHGLIGCHYTPTAPNWHIYTDDKPSSDWDIVILYYAIQIKIRVWQLVADKSPAAKIETERDFNMTEGSLKTISFELTINYYANQAHIRYYSFWLNKPLLIQHK